MDKTELEQTASKVWIPLQLRRLQADGEKPKARPEYGVTFIKAGFVRRADGQPSSWRILPEALEPAVPMFNARGMQIDHASLLTMFHPPLKDTVGVTFGAVWNAESQGIDGGARLYGRKDQAWFHQFLDDILVDQETGLEVPDVGLSAVFYDVSKWVEVEGGREEHTTQIRYVQTTDFVFGPGTESRLHEALSMFGKSIFVVGRPEGSPSDVVNEREQQLIQAGRSRENIVPTTLGIVQGGQITMDENLNDGNEAPVQTVPPVAQVEPEPGAVQAQAQPAPANGNARPVVDLNQVYALMLGQQQQIQRLTEVMARREEPDVVEGMGVAPRAPRIHGVFDSRDQIEAAYLQLMGLPCQGPVHRLSGIKELYLLLTGDREMRGEINLDLVPRQLAYSSSGANADVSTMAELTRNVMNKALVAQIDLMEEYQWWRKIARIDNFNSLKDVSWVKYGGIGYSSGVGLPTVAEKGEYQQLYWEDERSTATFVKKGGYLALSLEMIDKDDLVGWKDVPRQLGVASVVTLSYIISCLFTDNSGAGADLADSVGNGYAFNTTRGNLITQPLDQPNWDLVVDTMYKLSQLMHASVTGETRRIAVRPKYALGPIELESQGITAITSAVKPSTPGDRRPTRRVLPEENWITVPHWTNANNWAAVADPNLLPFVGVGFRFGDTPEIFIPADANYIVFLHDVLPIKVRWFYAVGVVETRGAIKSNAS